MNQEFIDKWLCPYLPKLFPSLIFPILLYFVPKIIVVATYKKVLNKLYRDYVAASTNPREEYRDLDNRLVRVTSFVSFVSINIGVLVNCIFSEKWQKAIFTNWIYSFTTVLCIIVFIVVYRINHKQNISLNRSQEWLEKLSIGLTSFLNFGFV